MPVPYPDYASGDSGRQGSANPFKEDHYRSNHSSNKRNSRFLENTDKIKHETSDDEQYSRNSISERNRQNDYSGNFEYNSEPMNFDALGSQLQAIDQNKEVIDDYLRDYYEISESVRNMTSVEAGEYRKKYEISVFGENVPNPIKTFDEAHFPDFIEKVIRKEDFKKPTPIQAQGQPMALSGRDCIGIAQTGSGKTLAFLLPALMHVKAQPSAKSNSGPIVLVISPTRELANQTHKEVIKYGKSEGIRSVCCYGGVPKYEQATHLRSGTEIMVGTPGRIMDFLASKITNFRRTSFLVLDEADRMLDMGFEPQIRRILGQVRRDRQMLLWSATQPSEIDQLSRDFLTDPFQVNIGSMDTSAVHTVRQKVEVVEDNDKRAVLLGTILPDALKDNGKVLIFCATKKTTDYLNADLIRNRIKSAAIHGDKTQNIRDSVLANFRRGTIRVMVATDVASRGLDVKDITCVVNYDFPKQIEDYVHRIGRTGRAGKRGISQSLFTRDDFPRASSLIKVLSEAKQEIPPLLRKMGSGSNDFRIERHFPKPWKERSQFERDTFNNPVRPVDKGYSQRSEVNRNLDEEGASIRNRVKSQNQDRFHKRSHNRDKYRDYSSDSRSNDSISSYRRRDHYRSNHRNRRHRYDKRHGDDRSTDNNETIERLQSKIDSLTFQISENNAKKAILSHIDPDFHSMRNEAWVCISCSSPNSTLKKYCEICGALRGIINRNRGNQYSFQYPNNDNFPYTNYPSRYEQNERFINSRKYQQQRPQQSEWICSFCSGLNYDDTNICDICDNVRRSSKNGERILSSNHNNERAARYENDSHKRHFKDSNY